MIVFGMCVCVCVSVCVCVETEFVPGRVMKTFVGADA
jgi:hypothetical protein